MSYQVQGYHQQRKDEDETSSQVSLLKLDENCLLMMWYVIPHMYIVDFTTEWPLISFGPQGNALYRS